MIALIFYLVIKNSKYNIFIYFYSITRLILCIIDSIFFFGCIIFLFFMYLGDSYASMKLYPLLPRLEVPVLLVITIVLLLPISLIQLYWSFIFVGIIQKDRMNNENKKESIDCKTKPLNETEVVIKDVKEIKKPIESTP